jgi:hypothetical protein
MMPLNAKAAAWFTYVLCGGVFVVGIVDHAWGRLMGFLFLGSGASG